MPKDSVTFGVALHKLFLLNVNTWDKAEWNLYLTDTLEA